MKTLTEITEHFEIPLVESIRFDELSFEEFINHTSSLTNEEGYIMRWPDGMIKLKSDHYRRLHRMLDIMNNEKELIKLILDDQVDDVLGVVREDLRDKLVAFSKAFSEEIIKVKKVCMEILNRAQEELSSVEDNTLKQKRFALEFALTSPKIANILFACWRDKLFDDYKVIEVIKNTIYKNCKSNQGLEKVRHLFNLQWKEYYHGIDING